MTTSGATPGTEHGTTLEATRRKPADFGRYLQLLRKSKGKTLEQVSQQTKISLTSLRQIENEDLSALPAPAFVKGFIRAYAVSVGADVQEALQRYESCYAERIHKDQVQIQRPRPSFFFWLRFVLVLLLFAALIAATLTIAALLAPAA